MKKNVMIFAAASMMALAISACGSKTEATTAAATELLQLLPRKPLLFPVSRRLFTP